ncbi:unnamed protein product, partial [Brenthis ino]
MCGGRREAAGAGARGGGRGRVRRVRRAPRGLAAAPPQLRPVRHTYTREAPRTHTRTRTLRADSVVLPLLAACAQNPSSGSLTASASESGSLERARAAPERRAPPPDDQCSELCVSLSNMTKRAECGVDLCRVLCAQHVASCRVENTRVNPDSLIDELLAATDLQPAPDAAETSGLQLYITRDGTAELGSRRRAAPRRDCQRVVLHPLHPLPHPHPLHDHRLVCKARARPPPPPPRRPPSARNCREGVPEGARRAREARGRGVAGRLGGGAPFLSTNLESCTLFISLSLPTARRGPRPAPAPPHDIFTLVRRHGGGGAYVKC